jgi:hypothetical protein
MLRILGRLVWWAPYPLPSVLGLGRRSSGSAVVKAPPPAAVAAAAVRWFAKRKYPVIQDRIGEQSKYKDLEDWEFAGDEEETKEVENDFRFQAEALHLYVGFFLFFIFGPDLSLKLLISLSQDLRFFVNFVQQFVLLLFF